MQYFFDESGDWSGRTKSRLVMGGLLISQDALLNRLAAEFKLLKASYHIAYLHAADMSQAAREDTYRIIADCLDRGAKANIRLFPPEVLFRSTLMSFEEIYIDLAASLVSLMILGDPKPLISYDMKFHYAYPEKVIDEIGKSKPNYYKRIVSSMQLREDKLEKLQEWLSGRLNQQINPQNRKLSWFLTEFKHQPANAISDYLWSELMLQVQGKEQARELFRAAILANVKNVLSMWGQGHDIPKLSINYMAKNNSNAGVELIDFLCNLVYQNGSVLPNSASSAVKKIYQMISVEVMKI